MPPFNLFGLFPQGDCLFPDDNLILLQAAKMHDHAQNKTSRVYIFYRQEDLYAASSAGLQSVKQQQA